jgi:hypothetical protein
VGPKAGLDVCEKFRPHRDLIPGPSSPQSVAIPTELPSPLHSLIVVNNSCCLSTVLKLHVPYIATYMYFGASASEHVGV